jgi:hypothetical protein
MRARALGILSRWDEVDAGARELMAFYEPGTYGWLNAAGLRLYACQRGDISAVEAVVEGLSAMSAAPGPSSAWGLCGFSLCYTLDELGRHDVASAVREIIRATPVLPGDDKAFVGYKHVVECQTAWLHSDDPGLSLRWAVRALEVFEQERHLTGSLTVRCSYLPALLLETGRVEEAEHEAKEAIIVATRSGHAYLGDWATVRRAFASAVGGDRYAAARARASLHDGRNVVLGAWLAVLPLHCELLRDPVDMAALAVAVETAQHLPRVSARIAGMLEGGLALAAALQQNWSAALAMSSAALSSGRLRLPVSWTMLYLAQCMALGGLGRLSEARAAAAAACDRLTRHSAAFESDAHRRAYRAQAPVARTFEIARAVGVESTDRAGGQAS